MKKVQSTVFLIAALSGLSGSVSADFITSTLNVSIDVQAVCQVSTSSITFPYTPGSTTTANGSVTVNCQDQTPYTIALDQGSNFDGQVYRRMSNNDQINPGYISYALYQDANLSTQWGDGSFNPNAPLLDIINGQPITGTGSPQPYTVYGSLANSLSGNEPQGTYTDAVTVTVTY